MTEAEVRARDLLWEAHGPYDMLELESGTFVTLDVAIAAIIAAEAAAYERSARQLERCAVAAENRLGEGGKLAPMLDEVTRGIQSVLQRHATAIRALATDQGDAA